MDRRPIPLEHCRPRSEPGNAGCGSIRFHTRSSVADLPVAVRTGQLVDLNRALRIVQIIHEKGPNQNAIQPPMNTPTQALSFHARTTSTSAVIAIPAARDSANETE